MYKSKLANYKFIKHILRSFSCVFISSAMISAGVSINTLAVPPRPTCDPNMLKDAESSDPTSPINYVRSFLGKRLGVLVMDLRLFVGTFGCLTGGDDAAIYLKDTVMWVQGQQSPFRIGNVAIPMPMIQAMDLRA
ncbi:MAG: hypothetical protein LBJ95_00245 [Oscillospiraceae bacterium]|nr:hypothetical protein [Oscillospiraceae bacterium]